MASNTYLRWLQSPTTAGLAPNASLHYITTTTTISEPTAILKHLSAQAKQVEKKDEKVLNVVNDDNGAAIETSTTLVFKMGGGAYLPSIDSNLLDERIVVFPLTHIVSFDSENRIQQIRLYWDQGSLLRQVEAIGKTGRNWPIRDGKAQADLVANSVKAGNASDSGSSQPSRSAQQSAPARTADVPFRGGRNNRDSVSVTGDPHASLALFQERDPNEEPSSYAGPKQSARSSMRPPPRDYTELFGEGGGNDDNRPLSPNKKTGAGKNFSEMRLFNQDEPAAEPSSPERKRTYSQKYEHFAFGDGEDAPALRPDSRRAGKNQPPATFSFEDRATPQKPSAKPRPGDERHWGAGVDAEDVNSPVKRPIVHAARPDAQTHFEMSDASPAPTAGEKAKSLQRQKGMGLYHDPVMEDERVSSSNTATTTNVNNTRRGQDFGSNITITDNTARSNNEGNAHSAAAANKGRNNARSNMKANWDFGGEEMPIGKIFKTAGDGMGSRLGGRSWGIGDDSDPEVESDKKTRGGRGGRRDQQRAEELDF